MMLALAVLSALTYLAVPSYTVFREDLHLAAAARELTHTLRNTRNQAALEGHSMQVRALDGNWGMGWQTVQGPDQQVMREQRLPRPVRIVGNAGHQVRFSALGVPLRPGSSFYGGSLHVCQREGGTSAYQIVIASSGRVQLRTTALAEPLCASR